jgi:hypothetical protein
LSRLLDGVNVELKLELKLDEQSPFCSPCQCMLGWVKKLKYVSRNVIVKEVVYLGISEQIKKTRRYSEHAFLWGFCLLMKPKYKENGHYFGDKFVLAITFYQLNIFQNRFLC